MSLSNKINNIFYLPSGIDNVNYQLIEETNLEYMNIIDFLQDFSNYKDECLKFIKMYKHNISDTSTQSVTTNTNSQILESPENNTEYNRLIPPYNASCCYSENGCLKKAAFKNSINQKLYCWFHVNCQNSNRCRLSSC